MKIAAFGAAIAICLLWLGMKTGVAFSRTKVQKQFHQSYPLATNGEVRLDNVNGKIRIVTWEQPEIKVDAIKRANTENDLDEVKIEIEAKPDSIRIHTAYPRNRWKLWGRGNSTSVDYDIQVPANVRLGKVENVNGSLSVAGVRGRIHASSVNGHLTAEGVAANVDLESVNGRVRVSFDNLQAVTHATVKTVNGGVAVILPPDASAEVSAHTLNGSINSGPDLAPKKHWPIGSDLHGTLGKGGTQISAETVNGSIQIRRGDTLAKPVSSDTRASSSKAEEE